MTAGTEPFLAVWSRRVVKSWNGALVGGTLHVRLRRFPASTIPAEGRGRWLFERCAEMDGWIAGKHTPEQDGGSEP